MSDETTPRVILDWDVMFCAQHLEPLRVSWPKHALFAMLGMFNAAARDERIAAECGGDAKELPAVLSRHKPVCCYIGESDSSLPTHIVQLALLNKVWGHET